MITILCDNFLTTKRIPDESINLIVTSPPYNLDKDYTSQYEKKYHLNRDKIDPKKDWLDWNIYLNFTEEWLTRAFDVCANDGRMCLNIPLDTNLGGQKSFYADVIETAKSIGWRYHTTIIWHGGNIHRRTAWGSFCSASAPWVITPVEMIAVMYKGDSWKRKTRGTCDITKEEFIKWTNGVWDFHAESATRIGHPAPFNVELPTRCMKLFSYVGDMILDPFNGSGSTMVACANNKRHGMGVDINPCYCKLAETRVEKEGCCTEASKVL